MSLEERRPRSLREVVFVDGVRTPFGKAGPKGIYAETRADDLVVRVIRELLRRNPALPADRVDEVAIAATTQIGDQGLTLGRTAALLAGLPTSVPGYSIDRMCAGAMTAVTTTASGIAFGAYDVAIAGGVEHMGRHPMGEGADPNPRFFSEKLVDESALVMGSTAENLHDRFPHLTKERADAFALASQQKYAKAVANGQIGPELVTMATRSAEQGWGVATVDEPLREEPRVRVGVEAHGVVSHVLDPTGQGDVLRTEADRRGGVGHGGHRAGAHAVDRVPGDGAGEPGQHADRATEGEALVALLRGGRDGDVVDAFPGHVRVALEQPHDRLDHEVVGPGVPVHALFTGSSERGSDPVDEHDFSSFSHAAAPYFRSGCLDPTKAAGGR